MPGLHSSGLDHMASKRGRNSLNGSRCRRCRPRTATVIVCETQPAERMNGSQLVVFPRPGDPLEFCGGNTRVENVQRHTGDVAP